MITKEILGIIIGGLLPAVLWALSGVFAKISNNAGIGNSLYIITLGAGVFLTGVVLYILFPDKSVTYRGGLHAFISGVFWASGSAFFALALTKYAIPLSKLVPLNNTSTLFAIFFAFIIFSEWQQVNSLKLIIGATLIILGSIIVSKA